MKGSALNEFILPDKALYLFLGIALLLAALLL
jgi:hypothetical protein